MRKQRKKQSAYNLFSVMGRLYKAAFTECPVRMLIYSLVLFANGVIQIVITWGTEAFFDSVSLGAREGAIRPTVVFTFLFLIAAMGGMGKALGAKPMSILWLIILMHYF